MDKPLVSVIVIFYNTKTFLKEAIDSILSQTYFCWELLLVDDGSSDGSTEIALEYTKKHPTKIFYHEHEGHQNKGMSATRNLGIKYAQGIYLTFLDADDVLLPNTLADQVELLELHPEAAMVYGSLQWWYSWTGKSEDIERDFIDKAGLEIDTLIKPPILLILFLQQKIAIAGMLLRKKNVDQVGGFESQFCGLYEDQVFCSKICLQYPVFVASKSWYKYRQHSESCCSISEKNGQEYSARQAFLQWLKKYIEMNAIQSYQVERIVDWELLLARHPLLLTLARPLPFLFSFGRRIIPPFILYHVWHFRSKVKDFLTTVKKN